MRSSRTLGLPEINKFFITQVSLAASSVSGKKEKGEIKRVPGNGQKNRTRIKRFFENKIHKRQHVLRCHPKIGFAFSNHIFWVG
jgi:hypothetical protein